MLKVGVLAGSEPMLSKLMAELTDTDLVLVPVDGRSPESALGSLDAVLVEPHALMVDAVRRAIGTADAAGSAAEPVEDGSPLSARESQVLAFIAEGLTQHQIARRLRISPHTVDTYLRRVRSKLKLGNKAELTRAALELGRRTPAAAWTE